MKAVAVYCRSCQEPQDGPSCVRNQLQEVHSYATRQRLTIHHLYTDRATSGITLDRPELRKLIADCHAGKIEAILTTDPERLSRDPGKLLFLLDMFSNAGVHVEFTTSPGRTHLEFLRVALSAVAEFGATANA